MVATHQPETGGALKLLDRNWDNLSERWHSRLLQQLNSKVQFYFKCVKYSPVLFVCTIGLRMESSELPTFWSNILLKPIHKDYVVAVVQY